MMKIKALMILIFVLPGVARNAVADTIDIREWLVPWKDSEPAHPYVDKSGRVWFAGHNEDFIANFSPETGEFNRYDLRKGMQPTSLVVADDRTIWFASQRRRQIASLNPSTGRVSEFEMPDRKAKDPTSIAFGPAGEIWFTLEDSNFIGRLSPSTGDIDLAEVPTRKTGPHGITVNSNGEPWAAASGRNVLLQINPTDLSITEVRTPNEDSRFRRIVSTSDNSIWYADYEHGILGRYEPQTGAFSEWPLPGGPGSKPHGMAVDRNDRIWLVETGSLPNRLIGFDTTNHSFVTETDIPSGAGSVSDMHYHEAGGDVWFGTASNYIARAKVH